MGVIRAVRRSVPGNVLQEVPSLGKTKYAKGGIRCAFITPPWWHQRIVWSAGRDDATAFRRVCSYITLKVSRTTIFAPPCKTGQPLALATASSSESALMTE